VARARVLVIDDDDDARTLVRELLERAGYETTGASGGLEGLRSFYDGEHDLVVLDVGMPVVDGWRVLDRIRAVSDVPVLMLTIRSRELEVVHGLKLGADDYVGKPFRRQELLARVEALLRRRPRHTVETQYEDELLTIDFEERRVSVDGREIALTPLEFKLLAVFARHAGQVLTHERLLELVWGDARALSRDEVRSYVRYLRRKLVDVTPDSPIETVRGHGYRYHPSLARASSPPAA
jgi:DNA-binding response OmpR family regulator